MCHPPAHNTHSFCRTHHLEATQVIVHFEFPENNMFANIQASLREELFFVVYFLTTNIVHNFRGSTRVLQKSTKNNSCAS